jgi:hypothetical protein
VGDGCEDRGWQGMGNVTRRLLRSQRRCEWRHTNGTNHLAHSARPNPTQATDSSPFAIEALRNHIHMEMAKSTNHTTSPSSANVTTPTISTFMNYLPSSISSSLSNGTSAVSDPGHVKARKEAKRADNEYREALDALEIMRLRVEEHIEGGLRVWDRWERERLGVVKTGERGSMIQAPLIRPSCTLCVSHYSLPSI